MKKYLIFILLIVNFSCLTNQQKTVEAKNTYLIVDQIESSNFTEYGRLRYILKLYSTGSAFNEFILYSDSTYKIGDTLIIIKK